MPAIEIKPDIYWIGVNDRTTDLFEGMWPITDEGVTYNSYLIIDEKKVIIDLSKAIKTDTFFDNISEKVKLSDLDYIVINHMEPDHTGVFQILRKMAPQCRILGTPKTKKMLETFYGITDNVIEVKDGETLILGKTELVFYHTPFVHWPETMMTYERKNRILFSCDGFGGYGALQGTIFNDQCGNIDFYKKESLRYYVNIVAKFSNPVLKAIDKLKDVDIAVIAPSHGLVWRKNPAEIVKLYKKWAEYAAGKTEAGITLLYGSMYGNTEMMMNAVAQGISKEGIPVEIFDVARTHSSYILPSLWTKRGVMIGAPTYEASLFPPMAQAVGAAVHKRIRNKKMAMFGSYGWSGGALRELEKLTEGAKWELTDSYTFIGRPAAEDLKAGENFGASFARLVKEE
ncbi:MAG: FprA family A-type flavoprotein [Spirochaetes bacterium]|nr:FprA family A-type flavoprotein [Spirochaetota bacterium]